MATNKKTVTEEDVDQAALELAELVTSHLHEEPRSEVEPFEQYVQKVRAQVHADANVFKKRFKQGYEVLLEEIKKNPPR